MNYVDRYDSRVVSRDVLPRPDPIWLPYVSHKSYPSSEGHLPKPASSIPLGLHARKMSNICHYKASQLHNRCREDPSPPPSQNLHARSSLCSITYKCIKKVLGQSPPINLSLNLAHETIILLFPRSGPEVRALTALNHAPRASVDCVAGEPIVTSEWRGPSHLVIGSSKEYCRIGLLPVVRVD